MAVSGTKTFALSINDCILEALDRIGGGPYLGYDLKSARRSLNIMFTDWANRGLNQWTLQKQTLNMVANQSSYDLDASTVSIVDVYITSDSTDFAVNEISLTDYNAYPNKAQTGRPSQYYLQKSMTPKLFLFPAPENSTDVITYWRIAKIDDVTASNEDPEVPSRFIPCMVSGLAYYIAMKKNPERVGLLKQQYEQDFKLAADEDRNRASLRLVPSRSSY